MTRGLILFLFLLAGLFSCSETDDIVVPGNQSPPDGTIEQSLIINYVSKVYISALGRKPSDAEETAAYGMLSPTKFSLDDRRAFVSGVVSQNEFLANVFNIAMVEFLENADTSVIQNERWDFEERLLEDTNASQSSKDYWQYEVDRFDTLLACYNELFSGAIDVAEMYRRISNNELYDDINMGTENFVVSTFQNYILRYPTLEELDNGKDIVNGFESVLFLKTGETKYDYMDIFFSSDEYYSGQVKYLFIKYLYRNPSSAEEQFFADVYKRNGLYRELAAEVLIQDEFAGIR